MCRALIKVVLAAVAALALVACDRRETSPAASVEAGKNAQKPVTNDRDKPDDAGKVADPMKNGY
jgi:hypothetical protein